MQVLQALGWLEKVELEMASFYAWLSERMADDAEASGFFFRMSIQERSHANLLRYGRKMVIRQPSDFGPVDVDPARVDELLSLIAAFREHNPSPGLEESLRFALRLEAHPVENLHRSILVESNPKVSLVISSLANADREHSQALSSFALARGVSVDEGSSKTPSAG